MPVKEVLYTITQVILFNETQRVKRAFETLRAVQVRHLNTVAFRSLTTGDREKHKWQK